MPTRESAAVGAPCWIDLGTSDLERAKAFYAAIFGWTFEEGGEEYGGYVSCFLDGSMVAGMMAKGPEDEYPDAWSTYLEVVDATATAVRAAAAGGQVVVEPMPIGGQGVMAFFADPGGASIGAWQPGEHKGYRIADEPGAPWWHELRTTAYEASVRFYQEVFGWETRVFSDTADYRCTLQVAAGVDVAGIEDATADLPPGVPSTWDVYFAVRDLDATLAQVVELGGSVVLPPEETTFGRLATAADPTGARFRLRAPSAAA